MLKLFKFALTFLCGFILTVSQVEAADLSVRLEQPKSPTNQDTFRLTFTTLDIQNRPMTVKCYKKASGEASFSQFGLDINLSAGGTTGNCEVTSSVVNTKGTYEFYVAAQAGSDQVSSSTVSVDFDNTSPDTPKDYRKEKHSSCQYTILFKTADDAGKTAKVEIYRSDKTEFEVNSTTRVGSVNIGSNQEGSFIDTVPDCNKEYFYVIRAFSSVGNGSGIIGDSVVTKVATTTVSPTPGAGGVLGAVPVAAGGVLPAGEALGEEAAEKKAEGEALGEATPGPETQITPSEAPGIISAQLLTRRNIIIALIILVVLLGYYFYRRGRQE